ncbi:hypothetical protein NBC122_01564 [Chryseobacterium salivictor]|uniref:Uncharacterized protein n=1 Tax=Chryseobacterium salivictor TaxID=2547600 RepID=A0A4P6ZFS9_9FLAO|nr:hypothetical protein NBC122_01564 [Chryseobacterium salivictor]
MPAGEVGGFGERNSTYSKPFDRGIQPMPEAPEGGGSVKSYYNFAFFTERMVASRASATAGRASATGLREPQPPRSSPYSKPFDRGMQPMPEAPEGGESAKPYYNFAFFTERLVASRASATAGSAPYSKPFDRGIQPMPEAPEGGGSVKSYYKFAFFTERLVASRASATGERTVFKTF